MKQSFSRPRVTVRSRNPLAWVSSVRDALRRSGRDPLEIQRFSNDALASGEPHRVWSVCTHWADVQIEDD